MSKNIIKFAINFIILTMASCALWMAEIGVATVFGITYKGVPYWEYELSLFQNGHLLAIGIAAMIGVLIYASDACMWLWEVKGK